MSSLGSSLGAIPRAFRKTTPEPQGGCRYLPTHRRLRLQVLENLHE
jgi:hypothetical protein